MRAEPHPVQRQALLVLDGDGGERCGRRVGLSELGDVPEDVATIWDLRAPPHRLEVDSETRAVESQCSIELLGERERERKRERKREREREREGEGGREREREERLGARGGSDTRSDGLLSASKQSVVSLTPLAAV